MSWPISESPSVTVADGCFSTDDEVQFHPTTLPAELRPACTVASPGAPFGSQEVDSDRDHCTRTGAPTTAERYAASCPVSSASLRPNELAPGYQMTRMFSSFM